MLTITIEDFDRFPRIVRYGVIETDRALTKAEMDHFDIVEVT